MCTGAELRVPRERMFPVGRNMKAEFPRPAEIMRSAVRKEELL